MIFEFLLKIPALIVQSLISLLPQGGTLPAEWTSAVTTMWGFIEAFEFLIPIDTLLWCLGIALTFHLGVFTFKMFNWIINKIPFVG